MPREIIFISHAKPEDNDLVIWLGSRLIGEGYRPWAELLDLDGGSPFWANIEDVIRNDTIRFISLLSKHSVLTERRGFRNELAIADAVGRKIGDDKFIIPLRLDDTEQVEFPAQAQQLHSLDFSRSWGEGYLDLLKTLERSEVPRNTEGRSEVFTQWRAIHASQSSMVVKNTEAVTTNILEVLRLPQRVSVYSYEGSRDSFPNVMKESGVPHASFLRLCVALADKEHIQELLPDSHQLKLDKAYPVEEFLEGACSGETRPARSEAKNMLTGLIREHLEEYLKQKGLVEYDAPGQRAFFFPKGLIENDKVAYRTAWNTPARKNLVGRSEKLKVYWHLAMKVNVSVGDQTLVRFKPYICWSEDGTTPIKDAKRTSSLRKRFCKSWWNPQWRTLQEAFVAFLADGEPEIIVDFGGANQMALSANLATFQLARSMPDDLLLVDQADDPPEPENVEDDLDTEPMEEEEA